MGDEIPLLPAGLRTGKSMGFHPMSAHSAAVAAVAFLQELGLPPTPLQQKLSYSEIGLYYASLPDGASSSSARGSDTHPPSDADVAVQGDVVAAAELCHAVVAAEPLAIKADAPRAPEGRISNANELCVTPDEESNARAPTERERAIQE